MAKKSTKLTRAVQNRSRMSFSYDGEQRNNVEGVAMGRSKTGTPVLRAHTSRGWRLFDQDKIKGLKVDDTDTWGAIRKGTNTRGDKQMKIVTAKPRRKKRNK